MKNCCEFSLSADPGRFFRFERVMLSSCECRYFIPMRFLEENGRLTVRYDCSGYSPISSYRIERTEDVLFILEKAVLILQHSAEYLIDPHRIALTARTVFYSRKEGDIRVAFVPLKNPVRDTASAAASFLAELSGDLEDGGLPLLQALQKNILENNLNPAAIIREIGLLRRKPGPLHRKPGSRTSGAS